MMAAPVFINVFDLLALTPKFGWN